MKQLQITWHAGNAQSGQPGFSESIWHRLKSRMAKEDFVFINSRRGATSQNLVFKILTTAYLSQRANEGFNYKAASLSPRR